MLGEVKKNKISKHLREYLEGQNIDPDKPLTDEEKGSGLDINNMPKEEVLEEKKEETPVNPALDALKSSIDKVGNSEKENVDG